ncbi:MAG: porin [Rubrivivax sp.]
MVSAGEGTASANRAQGHRCRLGWAAGPVMVSLAHTTSETELTSTGKFGDTVLGGSWAFGPAARRVSAAWRQFKQNASKQTNVMLAGTVAFGATELKASIVRANLAGRVGAATIDANDARQVGIGAVYNLSKRTALCSTASRDQQRRRRHLRGAGWTGRARGWKIVQGHRSRRAAPVLRRAVANARSKRH